MTASTSSSASPESSATYQGSCHCGSVRYQAQVDLSKVIACNCSICSRLGTMLTFVPPDRFKMLDGADKLTDYLFNKQVIHHVFCKTCGVHSFGHGTAPDGTKMFAINVRCLENVDLEALTVTKIDGKSF